MAKKKKKDIGRLNNPIVFVEMNPLRKHGNLNLGSIQRIMDSTVIFGVGKRWLLSYKILSSVEGQGGQWTWEFTLSDVSKLNMFISWIKEFSGFSKIFSGKLLMGSDVSKGDKKKKKIIVKISLILRISYGSKAILRKEQSSFTGPK